MAINEVQVSTPESAVHALAGDSEPSIDESHDSPTPKLAAGVELIGEFEGSGFKTPPYIARRADGQVVQMPKMLFALAEQIDGRADAAELAERFSHAIERQVAAADVQMLIDEQLRPLGVVATGSGEESVELHKVDPLLALKFRAAIVPDGAVRSLTTIFRPLFVPVVMLVIVLSFAGLDGWLFFVHGISQSVRHVLYQPALMLLLIAGVVAATAFHEIGHATACRYSGAKPGVMGVGIYIVWPAFYTDITDAYRLGKWGRLRTDVGGMYFNAIFAVVIGGLYALTTFEPLLLLIVLQTFAIIQQALPFLRLDGYYILSDLTGVPDIYLRIRAILTSLLPRREPDPRVSELRRGVRVVVTIYVVAMAAFLLVALLGMIINLPRLLSTGYDSSALHFQAIGPDFGHGQALKGILDTVEMLFLILPAVGLLYTLVRVGRRGGGAAIRWASGQPARQAILAAAGAAMVALAAFSWWPNGEYRPIQPGERGTVEGLFGQVRAIPSGRPSLTLERQRELGGAPTARQRKAGGAVSPQTTLVRPAAKALAPPAKQARSSQATDTTATTATSTVSSSTGTTDTTATAPSSTTSATSPTTDSAPPGASSTTPSVGGDGSATTASP